MFTVFTPSYNRGRLLSRVYESLKRQANKDFEWLIIDDGSTDDTSTIAKAFMEEESFSVRYIYKENGGKHTAHNLAVKEAKGEWCLCLDSDDWLADNAMETLVQAVSVLDTTDCGIIAGKSLQDGTRLSNEIDIPRKHCNMYEYTSKYNGAGEYALVLRTEILRSYPFPEIEGETFMGESVVYDRLGLEGFTMAITNKVIQICEYQEDGLTSSIYQTLKNNPTAYQIYHMQRIDLVNSFVERVQHSIRYRAFRRLSKNKEYAYCGKRKFLVWLMTVPGFFGALYYRRRTKSCKEKR